VASAFSGFGDKTGSKHRGKKSPNDPSQRRLRRRRLTPAAFFPLPQPQSRGATGASGAIAEIARQTLAKDFRRIDPRSSRIILLEAGARILPTLPGDLSRYAERALTRIGVDVRTNTRVTGCDRHGVELDHGRIDAGAVIWAAGVVASRMLDP